MEELNKPLLDNSGSDSVSSCCQDLGIEDNYHAIFPTCPIIPKDRPWLAAYQYYGIKPTIKMPAKNTSILEIFDSNFTRYNNRDAYICMGEKITYGQLDKYSCQVAAYLQSLGLKVGDKVAVMLPNILQYPIIALGIIRAGMILVNVNPLYTTRELQYQLCDSDSKAIFVIENFISTLQNVKNKGSVEHIVICRMGDMLGNLKGFVVNNILRHVKKIVPTYTFENSESFKKILSSVSVQQYQRPELNLSHIALLQYTGGTTGIAKGAMITHGNLIANMLQIDEVVNAAFSDTSNHSEIMLTVLPFYHVFSFMVCGIYGMHQGFTGLLIPNPRDIDNLIKEIAKYKPSYIPAVNTLFKSLLSHDGFKKLDFSNLKASLGGGTPILASVAKAWREVTGLPIIEGYGLTETSPLVSFNPMNIFEFTGKIGVPTSSTDVILIDDNGKEVTIGERGEICVKGPQVMLGYHKRPQETAQSFTQDGYFKTGDIGIIDTKGFIKIVDRKKDMILVSGFNVYPHEIEEVMIAHPAVLECGAIGVPSDERGEEPKLFVVKQGQVTEEELLKFGRKHLTGYKRPRHIQFINELPKSNVGKILRKELRKMEGLE